MLQIKKNTENETEVTKKVLLKTATPINGLLNLLSKNAVA